MAIHEILEEAIFQCIPHHPKPKANIQILYSRFTEKIPLTPETVASLEAK